MVWCSVSTQLRLLQTSLSIAVDVRQHLRSHDTRFRPLHPSFRAKIELNNFSAIRRPATFFSSSCSFNLFIQFTNLRLHFEVCIFIQVLYFHILLHLSTSFAMAKTKDSKKAQKVEVSFRQHLLLHKF